ncbi:LysR family transcriptional regulator [Marinobacterium weihaiense]|uniref:LysR family transcriptional regulator n=1 Tax=Marinobacterium weihaiense TaxID=2851016 RepID=A0ABS6M9G9_9GAMM|nr:LysR family transcriptional regulator [Marinobacterium weihaiense]MBV0932933.1 LysR family transcriptional regulator [Marinobacterium weihaiense]
MLNPTWLKTFRTLVDVGHFTRTAERLHMTQPGVSQHIRKLEQACGHLLLCRDGKGFELSEQGRSVYRYALELEAREARLLADLGADAPFSGVCRIACSGAMAMKLYPPLLALQNRHPGLVSELEAAPAQRVLQQVRDGDIDLGIVTRMPTPALFEQEPLGFESLSLVLPRQTGRDQTLAERLKALGLIHHPDALEYLELYCVHCGEAELERLDIAALPRAGYINQLHQILQPVAHGIGFTVLPQSTVDQFAAPEALQIHTPRQPVQEPLYLIHKRNRQLPARFDTLRETLRRSLAPSSSDLSGAPR